MAEARSQIPPEEQPPTSREEGGEPSGEEDPANEAEMLEATERSGEQASSSASAGEQATPESSSASAEEQAASAEGSSEAEDEDPLARAQRERDEYLDLARRTQADFENYRKRAAREASVAGERAKSGLVRELLPVVDNLERALASADAGEQNLAEGVRLVHSELLAVLERHGVQQFDPKGERFDPTEHEALSTREDGEAESGTVLDVVEKGYRANGSIIRPARVVVSA